MKVLVFGAAGATGRLTVQRARADGHEVSAFVRGLEAIEGAWTIRGDSTDPAAVAAALEGQDAVVSTLGVRKAFKSGGLIERSMSVIVPAMERAGVGRLVVMSALGVGRTREQAPWLPRLMYRLLLTDIFADKDAGERIVEASGLDWTIVYPPLLTDAPDAGSYRAGERLELSGMPKVSRADVAHFMVAALGSAQWSRKRVIVSG
ncbi:MAG TPA: NAD(P)-binding oxidoreductase [Usitatibacter sp.]|nr:NAD(P)-binding oxidoreductase [Usitatibacter sp.]